MIFKIFKKKKCGVHTPTLRKFVPMPPIKEAKKEDETVSLDESKQVKGDYYD